MISYFLFVSFLFIQKPDSLDIDKKFEFTPFLGVYVPVNGVVEKFDNGKLVLKERQLISIAIGNRLSYWFSKKLGVELNFSYAPSMVAVHTEGSLRDMNANLFLGNFRFFASTIRYSDKWSFYAVAGPGFIYRKNSFWKTANFGLGTRIDSKSISFRVEIEDNLRTFFFLQHDLLFTVGGSFLF